MTINYQTDVWGFSTDARLEMARLREQGGPRRPEFPAFVGSAVKGFPYNVMGNMMTVVNAV
jgi:hypothetical protein